MSFDEIVLPVGIIAEIYKDNIVIDLDNDNTVQKRLLRNSKVPAPAIPAYLGQNLKNIGILVNFPDAVYIPEKELELLIKILVACKLDMGDIAIVNTAKENANKSALENLKFRKMLVFGECLTDFLDENKPEFFVPVEQHNLQLIMSPALETLTVESPASRLLKGQLWSSLQEFFQIEKPSK